MPREAIKLLLVDDHEVFRIGLASVLAREPRYAVVAQAATQVEAVSMARACEPDIVIMDVRLQDGNGVEACREIRSMLPESRIIMLTSYPDDEAVVQSILAGASGYVLKEVTVPRLLEAIDLVANGGSLLDPGVTATALTWMRQLSARPQAREDPLHVLSDHERNILLLIAEGKTNREIAQALYLSEHTVKGYVSAILQKLQLRRRAAAAAFVAGHPPERP